MGSRTLPSLDLPEKLDSISFDTLLATQRPFENSGGSFDLSGVRFVSPAALVQLAAACHVVAREGGNASILVPDPSVRSYLARAGLEGALDDVAQIQPSTSRAYRAWHGTNPMLIEVSKIKSGAELPELLDRIIWALQHRLRFRKSDAFDVATVVSEVCQNTFDHNDDTFGFLAMQVYGGTTKRFLEIGIADYGIGLAKSLRRNAKNPAVSDDRAILLATRPGVSAIDDPTRGTGLHHLLQKTYRHRGSVQIRSGRAKLRFRMDKRRGWSFRVPTMPGVQIALTLPASGGS